MFFKLKMANKNITESPQYDFRHIDPITGLPKIK